MTIGENTALTRRTFLSKVISLLFNMLSRLVRAFLSRRKHLFNGCSHDLKRFWSPQNKVCHCFHCFPSICHKVMGPDAMILVFWMLSFKSSFSLSSFTFIKRLFSSSLSATRCYLHIWGNWYYSWQSWFQFVLHPAKHFSWFTLLVKKAGWQYTALT